VLLCTESGGEGRNVQFCNTLINFDLHWNPQALEQRIGRIHRIGQQREVFVFNLAVKGTIEDRILGILDEKINMFELVVGEIQSILGELDEGEDFAELVLSAWLQESDVHREQAFDELGGRLLKARADYEEVKTYDHELFGEEFEVV
jgi:superfamily II DNA/RNA helicase